MNDSLIINARHRLCWRRRLCSDASTAMLWGGWLWLWRPVLGAFSWLSGLRFGFQTSQMGLLAAGAPMSIPVSIESSMLALVSTSSSLLIWNFLTERQPRKRQTQKLQDYARHFGLTEQAILSGRNASVCVVHHDEHGRIVRIENRTPATGFVELRSAA